MGTRMWFFLGSHFYLFIYIYIFLGGGGGARGVTPELFVVLKSYFVRIGGGGRVEGCRIPPPPPPPKKNASL